MSAEKITLNTRGGGTLQIEGAVLTEGLMQLVLSLAQGDAPARRGRGGAKASLPGAGAKRRGGAKAAAKPAAAPRADVSARELKGVLAKSTPANHEQRVLLFGLAALRSGSDRFTTKDLDASVEALGITSSTIPGSLSKLGKAGFVSSERQGRTAIYSLTSKGRQMAERLANGETIGTRRGRRPKFDGPSPSTPSGKRGRRAAGAKAASPAGARPSRPASTLESLSDGDKAVAQKLASRESKEGERVAFDKLKRPQDRALWMLQRHASDAPTGLTPPVISYLLKAVMNVSAPANGVGAALKKGVAKNLVSHDDQGRYAITMDGRNALDALTR